MSTSDLPTDVVIFGLQDFASLAHFYLREDTGLNVVGFTVHAEYATAREFEGLPVVPFEDLDEQFPVGRASLLAPMSPRRANEDREAVFRSGTERGYQFVSYVSSRATTFSDFATGPNCFILEDNTIQPFVTIGSNVVLWSGNHIGHHSVLEDNVFVASHVVVSGHCHLESNCYLGVNSTLRDAARVGRGSMLGMGANAVSDTAPYSVNIGNPAKPTGADSRNLAL